MTPDYASYSFEELLDVLRNIDKANFPDNYARLHNELTIRGYFSEPMPDASSNEQTATDRPLQRPRTSVSESKPEAHIVCSFERVCWVLSAGIFGSLPIVYIIGDISLKGSDLFFLLLSIAMVGGALLHSIVYGWTISRMGVIKLSEEPVSFTIAQIFFSYLTCLFLYTIIAGLL